eukprot:1488114-Amphidinium_carterae.1
MICGALQLLYSSLYRLEHNRGANRSECNWCCKAVAAPILLGKPHRQISHRQESCPTVRWRTLGWVMNNTTQGGGSTVLALSVTHANLLKKCIELLDTFDPKRTTVDAYITDADCMQDKKIGEVEHKFIHQIFYGCNRFKKFLKLFVVSFLHRSPSVAIRAEQSLYTVLAYMLFFRLDELGVNEYRNFMFSGVGTIPALHCMIQYALSEEELNKWVKEEWIKAYDKRYIEEEIIGRLQDRMPDMRPLLEDLELKATGTITMPEGQAPKEKKFTTPDPFQITKPKPRLIPEPEVINRKIKAKPVPAMIHGTSLAEVEEDKKKRLEEQKAKVREKHAGFGEMHLETTTRRDPNERDELTKRVEAQKMAE